MNIKKTAKLSAISLAMIASYHAQADQVIQDDSIVVGSICIGFDCVNGENFGFDTIRLKENNVRIRAVDSSSTGSFPNADWQLTFNESSNGGLNKFSIEQTDSNKIPFTIIGEAPSNSLFINQSGNVGMGTTTPSVELEIQSGDSPTIRLSQDGSAGFTAQAWDVGGNESNFFIRDVSNGGLLPFRITPNAPNSSIHVAADGDVGFSTTTPDGQFDVAHATNANNHAFFIDPSSNVGVNIDNGFLPSGLFDVQTTGGVSRFTVNSGGSVGVGTSLPSAKFHTIQSGTALPSDQNTVGIFQNNENSADLARVSIISGSSAKGQLAFGTDTEELDGRIRFDHSTNTMGFFTGKSYEAINIHSSGANLISSPQTTAVLTTAGVWQDASSRELKKDIKPLSTSEALNTLEALAPVTYIYKADPTSDLNVGFIAEDVPDIVATSSRKSLASLDIIAILTKVAQDQSQVIADLSNRIKVLEVSTKN